MEVIILTEEAKAARRIYEKQWRAKNPEKVRARYERYWQKKAAELQLAEDKAEHAESNHALPSLGEENEP